MSHNGIHPGVLNSLPHVNGAGLYTALPMTCLLSILSSIALVKVVKNQSYSGKIERFIHEESLAEFKNKIIKPQTYLKQNLSSSSDTSIFYALQVKTGDGEHRHLYFKTDAARERHIQRYFKDLFNSAQFDEALFDAEDGVVHTNDVTRTTWATNDYWPMMNPLTGILSASGKGAHVILIKIEEGFDYAFWADEESYRQALLPHGDFGPDKGYVNLKQKSKAGELSSNTNLGISDKQEAERVKQILKKQLVKKVGEDICYYTQEFSHEGTTTYLLAVGGATPEIKYFSSEEARSKCIASLSLSYYSKNRLERFTINHVNLEQVGSDQSILFYLILDGQQLRGSIRKIDGEITLSAWQVLRKPTVKETFFRQVDYLDSTSLSIEASGERKKEKKMITVDWESTHPLDFLPDSVD